MIPFEIALGKALRHWKAILGAVVLLGLVIALVAAKMDATHWRKMHGQEVAAHKLTVANYQTAQAQAAALAERRLRETESLYRRNADEAENLHAESLADASARAAAYIAANRLRGQGAVECSAGGTAATAAGERAGVSAPAPAAPVMVAVSDTDIHACTAAVSYGDAAHSWAMTLNSER